MKVAGKLIEFFYGTLFFKVNTTLNLGWEYYKLHTILIGYFTIMLINYLTTE